MSVLILERGPHYKDPWSNKLDYTLSFFVKRVRRLLPASFFWSTVGVFVVHPHPVKEYFWSLVQMRDFEYCSDALGYFWSLSLENQFYLILPILAFCLPRKFFWFIIFLSILLFTSYCPGWTLRPNGLLFGAVTWLLLQSNKFKDYLGLISSYWSSRLWKAISLPIISLFLLSAVVIAKALFDNGPFLVKSFLLYQIDGFVYSEISLFTLLILVASAENKGFIYIYECLRPIIYWGGEISYSIYLSHITVGVLLNQILPNHQGDLLWCLSLAVAIITVGVLSYFFIERPFYRTKPLETK